MLALLVVITLAVGLFGGRLWGLMSSGQCPRCAINDERDRLLDELHQIEQHTTTQLINAAQAARQPGAGKHAAPRHDGKD